MRRFSLGLGYSVMVLIIVMGSISPCRVGFGVRGRVRLGLFWVRFG